MGRTLCHEHLLTASETVRAQYPHLHDADKEFARAVEQVRGAMAHGVRTIVDPACMDLGARRALRLARRRGDRRPARDVHRASTASTTRSCPHHFQTRDEDYLADAFVHDIEVGIQGTAVKAAFIKTAADEPGITPDVEKVHRAAARASMRTGAPIMAHSRPGEPHRPRSDADLHRGGRRARRR